MLSLETDNDNDWLREVEEFDLVDRMKWMDALQQEAIMVLEEIATGMEVRWDKRAKDCHFKVGEEVWLCDFSLAMDKTAARKLFAPWIGQCTIMAFGDFGRVLLRKPNSTDTFTTSMDAIKPVIKRVPMPHASKISLAAVSLHDLTCFRC